MILIRADATEQIGTGHVMRCLSIAQALAGKGEEVRFVTAGHRGDVLIRDRGFETVCLESDPLRMEEEPVLPVIEKLSPKFLLVDSYQVTPAYFEHLAGAVRRVYLDDGFTPFGRADAVIDYQIYADEKNYAGYPPENRMIGPAYAPLRAEFRTPVTRKPGPVREVLLSAGGADPEGISERLLRGLCLERKDIRFHLVAGALNPALPAIREQAVLLPNVEVHVNEKDMAGLMRRCDMAVSAAGTTLYELCACGVPAVTFILADNQIPSARAFAAKGLMESACDCRKDAAFTDRLAEAFDRLAGQPDRRQQISEQMRSLVDGSGAERIAQQLLGMQSA